MSRAARRRTGHPLAAGAPSVFAVSDDAGIAAMACGQGLDVIDLRTGALAFATSRGKKIARGVLGDTLLVTDGQSPWELAPDGSAPARHASDAVPGPTPRVHLAVRGDRVLVVADRDGAHRSASTVDPTVTTFAVI